jgi:hypothetical protein
MLHDALLVSISIDIPPFECVANHRTVFTARMVMDHRSSFPSHTTDASRLIQTWHETISIVEKMLEISHRRHFVVDYSVQFGNTGKGGITHSPGSDGKKVRMNLLSSTAPQQRLGGIVMHGLPHPTTVSNQHIRIHPNHPIVGSKPLFRKPSETAKFAPHCFWLSTSHDRYSLMSCSCINSIRKLGLFWKSCLE